MEEGMRKGSRCGRRVGNYSCKVIVASEGTEEIVCRDGRICAREEKGR